MDPPEKMGPIVVELLDKIHAQMPPNNRQCEIIMSNVIITRQRKLQRNKMVGNDFLLYVVVLFFFWICYQEQ